jgi:putative peptide zinc metalloprotease protein
MSMQDSPYSSLWYRVAELKPRLRNHATVERRSYRGQLWYVLQDQSNTRHFRFNPAAWYLIGRMDGEHTLQEIWDSAQEHYGEDVPSQDETIFLMSRLHAGDVLHCDVPPDCEDLFRRHQKANQERSRRRYLSPLSPRWSLLDPEKMLNRYQGWVRPLFTPAAAVIWVLVMLAAILLAVTHWTELSKNVVTTALAPHNLPLLWLCFPVLKSLHELGHAFATRIWGGEVHDMGIALLVLTPVPYVDASSASAFREKRKRVMVGAAGMMVELFISALALFLWLLVEPGAVRDIAAIVMFIAGISTVLFNANPLLKFDGYHMLVDAIEIPNLANRAQKYYAYLIQRYAFGISQAQSPRHSAGERTWFLCYGAAAFFFRLFIAASIVLFVAGKFFVIGVVLAIWAGTSMLLLPLLRTLVFLFRSPQVSHRRTRAIVTSFTAAAIATYLVGFLPVPFWTRVDGVIWMPEQAQVRAGVDGNITAVLAQPGSQVSVHQSLFNSEDPFLSYQVKILKAQVAELTARRHGAESSNRVQAEILLEELHGAMAQLQRAEEQEQKLVATAPVDGTFIVNGASDLQGRFVRQGDLLGYVAQLSETSVRVAVSQADIGLVRKQTENVQIRFHSEPGRSVKARLSREVPAANFKLPSKVLGSAGGGRIPVDPNDEAGLRVKQQIFQLELALLEDIPDAYYGERVQVRFDHGSAPLARQWYRRGRQLFLRSFGV